jgi:hypothetical protein
MNTCQGVLSVVFGGLVTFFVPAVVWTIVLVGVCQLAREGIGKLSVAARRSRQRERARNVRAVIH